MFLSSNIQGFGIQQTLEAKLPGFSLCPQIFMEELAIKECLQLVTLLITLSIVELVLFLLEH